MTSKAITKQELLRFKLQAYLRNEENKERVAALNRKHFESEAAKLLTEISALFIDEPGIIVTAQDSICANGALNVGWLELDVAGHEVKFSPVLDNDGMALEVSGLEPQNLRFELHDRCSWRARHPTSFGLIDMNNDFLFTKLTELVPG